THRGPLARVAGLGEGYYSRQWLPLRLDSIGLPIVAVNRARSWDEFNHAYDRMYVPAQCALYADRDGNIGYRTTGLGIVRQGHGRWPVAATESEWDGFEKLSD